MYGQQFSSPIASAAKWMFFGFVAIVLMAILLGADIKDATWFNPNIAAAEANRINVESAHQQATYELQERLTTAETESEIQTIQREKELLNAQYAHDIQILAQDVANHQTAFDTWMTLIVIIGRTMSIAIIIGVILWFGSKALANVRSVPLHEKTTHTFIPPIEKTIHPLPEQESYDPWSSPAYRRQRVKAARQEERNKRKEEITALMKAFRDPSHMSTEQYNKYPLAGD